MVECGGLENRLAGIPRYEGSNPSLSASYLRKRGPGASLRGAGIVAFSGEVQTERERQAVGEIGRSVGSPSLASTAVGSDAARQTDSPPSGGVEAEHVMCGEIVC